MKENILVVHGGAPTAVMNASLYGVIREAEKYPNIDHIYAAIGGSGGILKEHFLDLKTIEKDKIESLPYTPASAIGTSRDALEKEDYEQIADVIQNKIRYVFMNGGNGSMDTCGKIYHACKEKKYDVIVVGIPKTIDNDVACTDVTFGFNTAVSVATEALDRLHTTAETHNRIMVLEVMGRYAGWITLEAAIAGGADVALLPEIPYDIDKVVEKIKARQKAGKNFSVVVVSEGAFPKGGSISVKNTREGGKGVINIQLGGAGDLVAQELEKRTGLIARNTTLGYMQRGGTPTSTDRILSTKYGAKAMELALEGKFNVLTVLKDGKLDYVSLEDVVGDNKVIGAVEGGTEDSNMKTVKLDDDLIKTARDIGICLGD